MTDENIVIKKTSIPGVVLIERPVFKDERGFFHEIYRRNELKEVGLSLTEALKQGIPIDIRRSTKHKENVETLRRTIKELKPEPPKKKKIEIIKITKVKGIGPKTAEQLKKARIKSANELAASSPETIAKAIGSSEERASRFIENANSLLKEES